MRRASGVLDEVEEEVAEVGEGAGLVDAERHLRRPRRTEEADEHEFDVVVEFLFRDGTGKERFAVDHREVHLVKGRSLFVPVEDTEDVLEVVGVAVGIARDVSAHL